jgi:glycosyltransferase involved in cell wall biosynthesis
MRGSREGGRTAATANVLVDLGDSSPVAATEYLTELRRRIGPEVDVDARWSRGDRLSLSGRTQLLQRGPGSRALSHAVARSIRQGQHLLFLSAPVLLDDAVLCGLLGAFDLDPMIGFAQPRFGDLAGEGIWPLPGTDLDRATLLPRSALPLLPDHYLTPERLAACLAIRREAVAGFCVAPDTDLDARTALVAELCQARRRGFRNLVMNRLVLPAAGPVSELYPDAEPCRRDALRGQHPDVAKADQWFKEDTCHRFERLATRARRPSTAARIPVLLDCRGAQAFYNGTTEAILRLLDGLQEEEPTWDIDLLFQPQAVEYHRIERRWRAMRIVTELPAHTYAAAVRMDQPWHVCTVADMHRRAPVIAFHMLDTIAWDILYQCSPDVAAAWHFIARYADSLAFNSAFTRDRFNFRFPVAQSVKQAVTHHSLHPDDYRRLADDPPEEDRILVFGNHYPHKAQVPTIELLSNAFPYQQITAVGAKGVSRHNVSVLEGGHIPDDEIDRLLATARLVVFPSYYEGFGFPVVKALSYGRTVVVRASPLWRELAGLTRMPGRLVEFNAPHELVELVGMALHGEAMPVLSFGEQLTNGDTPFRWRDCSRRLVAMVEQMLIDFEPQRWQAREQALALAGR